MHSAIKMHIFNEIDKAANFVLRSLPVDMPTDEIYEALVGEPHILEKFRAAAEYLPLHDCVRHVMVTYDDRDIGMCLRFKPTAKWRHFLYPFYKLTINSQSKLGQAIATAVDIVEEWRDLRHVTERFMNTYDDHVMVSFFMPWLRTLDFNGVERHDNCGKAEWNLIQREIKVIKARPIPVKFPSLTHGINEICLSGKKLFGQYRMLQTMTAAQRELSEASPVYVYRAAELPISHWINTEFAEIRSEYQSRLNFGGQT